MKARGVATTGRSEYGVLEFEPLPREFYLDCPEAVARRLVGKLVVRRMGEQVLAGRIVEVEAYLGAEDPAAHAYAGQTARNAVLFGPAGHAYVYFIYGMHYCLNVSCEPEGKAGCVLIRALEPVAGSGEMARLRHVSPEGDARLLTMGPGRLCQALGITRAEHDGVDVTDAGSSLYLAGDRGNDRADFKGDLGQEESLGVTPRVGIRKAAELPLRFYLKGSRFVTRPPAPGKS